jgi:hypothetical protein
MSEETRSVEEIKRGWNPPPKDTGTSLLVGTAGSDTPPEVVEESEYDSWSKQELQDEAEARDLSKSGSKAELIARLQENDAEQEGDPDADPDA